ncbi:MAG: DUF2889 domain-containing protein [Rhodospirillaceae bacterium]|nr:DUF2889 domain-containing protein [Rhodospirillaceae bacterium]MCY4237062.1 DUF2889 domain-containing protein [Rhodospirillaceae bacterium]MCY4311513.1 DUF2889 domain-containing protein [Rhodospirillaceae bacterium]
MPLATPVDRELLHTRAITMRGYIREDGLWDIEGHLTDNKSYAFDTEARGRVEPDMPVHEMRVRLTVDDNLVIQACEASTDHHPYPVCPSITPAFSRLAGIRIGVGWMREVRRVVGGRKGCTHIVEMLAQMGTVAYQTHVAKSRFKGESRSDPDKPGPRPLVIDTCHAMASDGPLIKARFPEYYTGD